MTFLTEMGDLNRFKNRREIAAYLGICPASYESGEANDRKGHITRQGPSRLRRMLCQAAWAAVNHDETMRATYERIRGKKKGQAKKAIVAIMRRLSIVMWHVAQSQRVSEQLIGRGGPYGRNNAVEKCFSLTIGHFSVRCESDVVYLFYVSRQAK